MAERVTRFVANSSAVADRVKRAYDRDATVVYPPVRTDFFTPGGERAEFFLYVGRLVAYKNAELVVRAFADLGAERLLVVGDGHLGQRLRRIATPNVSFLGRVSDEKLRDLYRAATALVYPANEDFGISMAEAQACGTPVVGLAAGGALDIVSDGETGVLIARPEIAPLRRAISRLPAFDGRLIRGSAERFSRERFRAGITQVVLESLDAHRYFAAAES